MRRILCIAMLILLLVLTGCGKTKTITCDGCGNAIEVQADSNVEDSWIVYCKSCENSLFGPDGIIP